MQSSPSGKAAVKPLSLVSIWMLLGDQLSTLQLLMAQHLIPLTCSAVEVYIEDVYDLLEQGGWSASRPYSSRSALLYPGALDALPASSRCHLVPTSFDAPLTGQGKSPSGLGNRPQGW